MRRKNRGARAVLALLLTYLLLPILVVLLYSLSSGQAQDVALTGWSWAAYRALLADRAFLDALLRTALLCLGCVVVTLMVMTPLGFAVTLYAPRLERPLRALMLVPYAVPGVVIASALLRAYAGVHGLAVPWILGGAYFLLIMPVVYQGVRNSLGAMDIRRLAEAAQMLGASPTQIFLRIVLPGVIPGVLVSGLLSFAALFSEFVMASMLTHGDYDTVQIYLQRALHDGTQAASAVVMLYMGVMTLLCALFLLLFPYVQREQTKWTGGKR